jgi:pimeloyl-ACP methyl ester carboxylesterase
LRLVHKKVMRIMFGEEFLTDPARAAQREECRRQLLANHRLGIFRATQGVIDRKGIALELARIRCPTLILVGNEDVATPLDKARKIQSEILNSRLEVIAGAGHSSTIEQPEAVTALLSGFLGALS